MLDMKHLEYAVSFLKHLAHARYWALLGPCGGPTGDPVPQGEGGC